MRLTYSERKLFEFIISFTILVYLNDIIFNTSITAQIAQLGERQAENLKVPSSNPENVIARVKKNPGSRHILFLTLPL